MRALSRQVGESVAKVKAGDRVIVSGDSCGKCPSCQVSLPSYCYEFFQRNFSGGRPDGTTPLSNGGEKVHTFMGQGSFATHVVCHDRNIIKVADDAPLELLGAAGMRRHHRRWRGDQFAESRCGQIDRVFGTGSVGLSGIMAAKLVGAGKIIAVDLRDDRLKLALELGATHTINPNKQSIPDAIKSITGTGVDFTLETTALMPILRLAIDVLALRGTCGFVGGAPEDFRTYVRDFARDEWWPHNSRHYSRRYEPGRIPAQIDRTSRARSFSARKARHVLFVQGHQSGDRRFTDGQMHQTRSSILIEGQAPIDSCICEYSSIMNDVHAYAR